jgi:putative ubiquitin-RnfH superfamily antitoxin RatB of RatAB toxin-antitoxin module
MTGALLATAASSRTFVEEETITVISVPKKRVFIAGLLALTNRITLAAPLLLLPRAIRRRNALAGSAAQSAVTGRQSTVHKEKQ